MDLLDNPFFLLGATPRDNRNQIYSFAEEKSLLDDSTSIDNARADLTNPRKRLTAEISWLPGISPKLSSSVLLIIQNNPSDVLRLLKDGSKLPSLTATNLIAASITRLEMSSVRGELSKWIINLAELYERVEAEQVRMLINEDRSVSGFPSVSDLTHVEEELYKRSEYFKKTINNALDKLDSREIVSAVTTAVETSTDNGINQAPSLIHDVVDSFEVEAQPFMEKETNNIKLMIGKIRSDLHEDLSDKEISKWIDQLTVVVKNWDIVAQPMQVSARSRGLSHDLSHEVSMELRSLSLDIFNDFGHVELSKKITKLQQEVFAEVDSIVEASIQDEDALNEIAENREKYIEQSKERAEEWKNEITYETELGVVFKDKLKVSPDGVEYKNKILPLDEIVYVRWGGIRNSINGIPTGTTYTVNAGTNNKSISVDTRSQDVYANFVDSLWKAVGARLLTQYLEGLRDGEKYNFKGALVDDYGIELTLHKLFGANKRVYLKWSDLVIWNGAGTFSIGGKDENKKATVELSYLDDNNAHILEAAIQAFWKKGGPRLSGLLNG